MKLSGSLFYEISAGHVYQRKFGTEDLAEALKGYHLYAISRRPATRINEASIKQQSSLAQLSITLPPSGDARSGKCYPLSIDWSIEGSSFHTYMGGSYFSVSTKDGHLLHGDAWALATAAMGAPVGIADQEILYIGQAYGRQGERFIYDRTKEHAKLQRIYEEHAGESWDIFVSPIMIDSTHCNNWDHLPDDRRGFDLDAASALYGDPRDGSAPKLSVDVVEHALISAFDPPYNDMLRSWSPANPTAGMRRLQACGFRLMTIAMNGIDGMARYFSEASPARDRGKSFHFGLTEAPKRPALDPLDPEDLDYVMQLNVKSLERMAQMAEMSHVVLRWFGAQAPTVRKPPQVNFW